MDISVENSKSLGLQSSNVEKSCTSASEKRFFVESSRKRSSTEVSLSDFRPVIKKRRNSLSVTRLKTNGFTSGVGKQENPSNLGDVSHKCSSIDSTEILGNNLKGYQENPDRLGDNVVIPKWPRGISRRKNPESPTSLKRAIGDSAFTCKNSDKAQINEPRQVSTDRRKKNFDELKENASGIDTSVSCIKGESSSRRARSRKKKGSKADEQAHLQKQAPLVDEDGKFYGDFQEDGKENLEENAAWMLSSRFNPRCTGFLGNRMESSPKPASESLFQLVSGCFKGSNAESSRIDAAGRVLRPKKRNGKGFARKRRHFYEVCSGDVDPYCVLTQRIKIFWPLDKSWYFGVVRDYDPVTRLHYVKYNDRDEEWINLQHARFKLLLFPSEVTNKLSSERPGLELKPKSRENDRKTIDGNCVDSSMELEPIISWLAQSTQRVELSPDRIIEKQSSAHFLKDLDPSTLSVREGQMDMSPSSIISNILFPKCIVSDWSVDGAITKMPLLMSKTGSDDRRSSFVYFRKRFRKRREEPEYAQEQDSAPRSSASSISILASFADRVAALEELNITATSLKFKQVTLKLSLLPQFIHGLAYGAESIWLCRAFFLLQFGKLMSVWPMVHMEIVFVDDALGLRLLSFEGCLRWVVTLACLIIRTFFQDDGQSKFAERQMPFTSIGFKFSGLHDQGHQLLFVLSSFLELEGSKWRFLEDSLKQHCVTMRELPRTECTYSNIKTFQSRSIDMFYTSDFLDLVSHEGSSERSCSDIMLRHIPMTSVYSNMDPALCYFHEKYERLPPRALSFAAAPSPLLSLHLKLLIESNAASVTLQKSISISSHDYPDYHGKLNSDGFSPVENPSDQVSEITLENLGSSVTRPSTSSRRLPFGHSKFETDALSVSNDGDWLSSFHNFQNSEVSDRDVEKNKSDVAVVRFKRFPCHTGPWRGAEKSCFSFPEHSSSSDKSDGGYNSCLNTTAVHAKPSVGVVERSFDEGTVAAQSSSDLIWEMQYHSNHRVNPTVPRSIWHHNLHSSVSPTSGCHKKLWREDFMLNVLVSGSKKPRNHLSFPLPFGGFGLSSKPRSHRRKARPYKKIRTSDAKRMSAGSGCPQSFPESLACVANVLITTEDRGWRECGAQILLDSDDQKDSRICVKFSGATKYVHKAHHSLQPGITNRYTHAMMWKGGNNWALEFTDRSQWSRFKEMHEECCNRNIRAAAVRNIPIPGVRLIADDDDNIVEVPFSLNPLNYIWQVGTEVDMALDPSRVLYDMDSSDEDWILKLGESSDTNGSEISEVTYDMFECVMDMFEKLAYTQQRDEFTSDEIEKFMADVGPLDIIKAIYEHWQQKRQKKGLPLIRQFQPALWEYYQQQLKKWESAIRKTHSSSNGCQDKEYSVRKPPMFAFCLRPRGLEVHNKWSKQKSHKKFMFTGHHNALTREKDDFRAFGRKLNRFSVGEKALFANPCHESFDSFHWLQSPSSSAQRDTAKSGILTMNSDDSEKYQYPKHYRNNPKKTRTLPFPSDSEMLPLSYDRKSKGNAVHWWSSDMYEWLSTKQLPPDRFQRNQADIDELRLRDASNAAQCASNMAKLKREKAQRLLNKADLTLHRATVALMIAKAMKASEKDLTGNR